MLSSAFFPLLAFALSVAAKQIQSTNPAFSNAGIQGCIAAETNADGSPLVIHNCNNEPLADHDWQVSFFTKQNTSPKQIKVFGDKCIDVTNGVNADGTKLQIWTCANQNTNQMWVSRTDGTFQWSGTNKCIDLTDGKITDGNVLQIWTCTNGDTNQGWKGEPNPDESQGVHVVSADSPASRSLCMAAASDADGAAVAIVSCSDFHPTFPSGNVTWRAPVAPLTGTFSTFGNKCLDVTNGVDDNGTKLQIWTCTTGNTNQKWTVQGKQIQWAGTGKCLDLTDGKTSNGNPIQIWDCVVPDDNKNQDWTLSPL